MGFCFPSQGTATQEMLPIPRRAFPAQVVIRIDALPEVLAKPLQFQQTAWLPAQFAAHTGNDLGDQAELVRGTEGFQEPLGAFIRGGRHNTEFYFTAKGR